LTPFGRDVTAGRVEDVRMLAPAPERSLGLGAELAGRGDRHPRHGPPSSAYTPKTPAQGVLYQTVRDHLETFRVEAARVYERDALPRFIEEEFRGFLRCGFLAGGFARFRCGRCGLDRLVPFSCKGRAVCPSCGGRRMAERAAHLVDDVFPVVPVRQWVLSLPHRLAALTPRPRINLLLYYGILGARSAWRSRLRAREPETPIVAGLGSTGVESSSSHPAAAIPPRTNWLWAELMQRSFGFDVLAYPRCGDRLELIALIEDPKVIPRILSHLGLPTEVPAARPARSPPLPIGRSDPWYEEDVLVP
jgi:hypothetical protein